MVKFRHLRRAIVNHVSVSTGKGRRLILASASRSITDSQALRTAPRGFLYEVVTKQEEGGEGY